MEYFLKKIKKQILAAFIILPIAVSILGCGMETKTTVDTKSGVGSSTRVGITSCKAVNKDIISTTDDTGNSKNTDQINKVPIYGKKQKEKIKKYLSSLPDKITVKEAKKRGIIIASYNDKEKKRFKKDWMDFYRYVKAGEKQYSTKNEAIICYAKLHDKCAITILDYTVEGDACYTYLSFIKGKYYMLRDSSRDNFKAPTLDGYSDLMTYKSLRKYIKYIGEDAIYNLKEDKHVKDKLSIESTQFYLFKKQDITNKKVKKIIGNPNYNYLDDYYNIFGFDA